MLFIEAIFGNSRKMETIQMSMKGNLGGQMTNYTKEQYMGMLVNGLQLQPSTCMHLIKTVKKQVTSVYILWVFSCDVMPFV